MSSEHADVYEEIEEDFNLDANVADGRYEYLSTKENLFINQFRVLTVDVNNVLSHLSMIEENSDMNFADTIEDQNPDCFVLVYAVDDLLSFGEH